VDEWIQCAVGPTTPTNAYIVSKNLNARNAYV
jgi:hypothetical protein